MALPTNSIRTVCKKRLIDLLDAQTGLDGVQVSYGWPGKHAEDESVWADDIADGEVIIENHIGPARKQRVDRFTILMVFAVTKHGQDSAFEAETRVETLYKELENVLALYPQLANPPTFPIIEGVSHAVQAGPCVGPEAEPTDEGWAAFMSASVEVRTHLH